jgi:hypothetical protein
MTDEIKPPSKDDLQIELWNRLIPNSEMLLAWFRRDEWVKILAPFLSDLSEIDLKMLLKGGTETTDDKFRMGRLSMLREIIALPATLDRITKQKTHKGAIPQGPAGY